MGRPKKEKTSDGSLYEDVNEDMNKLIDNTEDIEALLVLWKEEDKGKKLQEQRVDRLKSKIRAYLKERQWDRHEDKKTGISVTLSVMKRSSIDKKQLQMILSEGQLAQVTRITTSEMMRIITPEARERLKKIIK